MNQRLRQEPVPQWTLRNWRTTFQWTALAVLAVTLGEGCLVSNLSNSFDLKSPSGFLGYLTVGETPFGTRAAAGSSTCVFDEGAFDACRTAP